MINYLEERLIVTREKTVPIWCRQNKIALSYFGLNEFACLRL